MITKYDTSSSPSKSGGGGSKVLMLLGLAVGGYLLYRYVIKPKMDEKKDENTNNNG